MDPTKFSKLEFARWICDVVSQNFRDLDEKVLRGIKDGIRHSRIELVQEKSFHFSSTGDYDSFVTQVEETIDDFCMRIGMVATESGSYSHYLRRNLIDSLGERDLPLSNVNTPFVSCMPISAIREGNKILLTYGLVSSKITSEVFTHLFFWTKTRRTFSINAEYATFVWDQDTRTFRYNFSDEPIFKIKSYETKIYKFN